MEIILMKVSVVVKWTVALTVIVASYLSYSVSRTFDFNKQVELKGQELCSLVKARSFSHFVKVKDAILASSPQDGAIFQIREDPFSTSLVDIVDWPGHEFKPQGMTLFKGDSLYVANSKGTTVEVFKIQRRQTELRLVFLKTIQLVRSFEGALHSIVVTSPEELYVTEAQPIESSESDPSKTLNTALRFLFMKSSSVQHCSKSLTEFICTLALPGAHLQGLYYNGANLFVADTVQKEVIRLKRREDGALRERSRIHIGFSPVQLQAYEGSVYVVGPADFYEAFTYNANQPWSVRGAIAEIKREGKDWVASEVLVEDLGSGACSVLRTEDTVLVGHCLEPSLLICAVG